MGGGKCDPLHPGHPTLGDEFDNSTSGGELDSSMCLALHHLRQKQSEPPTTEDNEEKEREDGEDYEQTPLEAGFGHACRALSGGALSLLVKRADKVDVRLQYSVPTLRCWPCEVSYSVSAKISEEEYLAFGFKGMAYRALKFKRHSPERPCYFGMCLDEVDKERTGNANMVLGYAGGHAGNCVRQMESKSYAGPVSDVPGNPDLIGAHVERRNGRTVLSFKLLQHVGTNDVQIHNFFSGEQLSARTMWAVGSMEGAGCGAAPQFHRARGLSPLAWFAQNPHTSCRFNADEFGHSLDGDEVSV